jgi:hypothetical protein
LWKFDGDVDEKRILRYMNSNMTTNSFEAKFLLQKKIDLIFIFNDAKKGDKLIIDNFIESVINE